MTPSSDRDGPSRRPRARRRWLWIAAALPVLVVLLLLAALPLLLDVERHRGRIETALREATGWDAELGEIELSVWSGLALTVSPARLAAPEGGSSFDVERIAVRAALRPLLDGRLEIHEIELVRAQMVLVRPDAERGWVLPNVAARDAPDPEGHEATGGRGPAVSIAGISVRDATLRAEDHSARPPKIVAVERLDLELDPTSGSLSGSAELADDGGELSWEGSPDAGLDVVVRDLRTERLAPWVGQGVLHPGGRIGGEIAIDLPGSVRGKLHADSLRVLAGVEPLRAARLEFEVKPDGRKWRAERLSLRTETAEISGSGTVLPLALELTLPPTPLEQALALTDATFPLGLDVEPPGSAQVSIGIEMPVGGALAYHARGQLTAASFRAADVLPEARDVRAEFRLARDGSLTLRILEASVGGGPLEGTVRIDDIDPLGTLEFDGKLTGASLGTLLEGFVEGATERIRGPSSLEGRVTVDLGASTIDASSIGGALAIGAADVSISGWDLEGALREGVLERLGALGRVAALVDDDARRALEGDPGEAGPGEERLLDRLAADVEFAKLPWPLPSVTLRAGGVSAGGTGSFDPLAGTVDLRLTAELDPATTQEYLRRHGQLRPLVNRRGNLSLPIRVRGPLSQPGVDVELDQALENSLGAEPDDAVKGLLEGLIQRKLKPR